MRDYVYVVTITEFMTVVNTWIYTDKNKATAKYLEELENYFPEVEPKTIEAYMDYMISDEFHEDGCDGLVQLEKVALK